MTVELLSEENKVTRADRMIGEVLANRYQIESRLGEGAMGSVYKAKHVKVGRAFAVKVLHKKLIEDRKVLQRFEREAELAGRLRHPNVIGVVDVGETHDGYRYMVMDFAEGLDLATMLGEAPMPAERITHLTRQILEGLYHAHEQGLIHRDFKPENVIIERDDHDNEVPRIVDFGIAILREGGESASAAGRLTTNGLVLGTPHYMAPEQAVADPIDHRIDLFALGIVIYEMLCGKLPFDGTGAEVARANLLLDPPLIAQRVPYLEVDPLLEAFARKLMAKKRELRPATAKVARELLDLITNDRQAAASVLNVPLTTSLRQPAITQPVSPQREETPSAELEMLHAPVVEVTASSPSLKVPLEGPPVLATNVRAQSQPEASITELPRGQRAIRTDPADPLTFGGKSGKRTWILAAVIGFSVAAIVTVVILKKNTAASDVPVDDGTKVVMNAKSDPPPPPPPAKIDTPAPPPVDNKTDVPPPVVEDPPVVVEPPKVVKVKKPIEKKPTQVAKLDPKTDKTKIDSPKTDATKVDASKVIVDPPKPAAMDGTAFRDLYQGVGKELAAVRASKGADAIAPYEARYRMINYMDATTPSKRDAAAASLHQIRSGLAALRK